MANKTLILSSLLAALVSNDAGASETREGLTNELLVQREALASRLDALKPKLDTQSETVGNDQIAQWNSWSSWQSGWNNY